MDNLTPEQRSRNMRRIRSTSSKPELVVRSMIWKMGFRYRLHLKNLPGKPDIVFTAKRKVVFIHGCFWHQHAGCKYAAKPKSHSNYWNPKLAKNIERDRLNQEALINMGWKVHIVWECETKDLDCLREKIYNFLKV